MGDHAVTRVNRSPYVTANGFTTALQSQAVATGRNGHANRRR
jgi:hypothetical protein